MLLRIQLDILILVSRQYIQLDLQYYRLMLHGGISLTMQLIQTLFYEMQIMTGLLLKRMDRSITF